MKDILCRILLLLGFALPTEVIAIYIEHTYFNEIGFFLSILITFFLAMGACYLRAKKTWAIGNLITLSGSFIFELNVDSNFLSPTNVMHTQLVIIVFVICWIIPQAFGGMWGQLLVAKKRQQEAA